jgi:hypothetical protein
MDSKENRLKSQLFIIGRSVFGRLFKYATFGIAGGITGSSYPTILSCSEEFPVIQTTKR